MPDPSSQTGPRLRRRLIAATAVAMLMSPLAGCSAASGTPGAAEQGTVKLAGTRGSVPTSTHCTGELEALTAVPGACAHGADTQFEMRQDIAKDGVASTVLSGGSPVRPTCYGDGSNGNRIRFLYGYTTTNRRSAYYSQLERAISVANGVFVNSAKQTHGSRSLRVVTSKCVPVISSVKLTSTDLKSFDNTIKALQRAGYKASNRKYVLFAESRSLCGIGTVFSDSNPSVGNRNNGGASYARVDKDCWNGATAAHEITHMLGGVQLGAPNATKGFHCTDDSDLMCYADAAGVRMRKVCSSSQEIYLDCNKNDYFNTAPARGSYLASHWDVAQNSFLIGGGGTRPTPPGYISNDYLSITDGVGAFSWAAPKTGSKPDGYEITVEPTDGSGSRNVIAKLPATTTHLSVKIPWAKDLTYGIRAYNAAGGDSYMFWGVKVDPPTINADTTPDGYLTMSAKYGTTWSVSQKKSLTATTLEHAPYPLEGTAPRLPLALGTHTYLITLSGPAGSGKTATTSVTATWSGQ